MSCTIDPETIERVIAFHGHSCPGLAIGIRAAESALEHFAGADPAELVAVVETDMCGVDAIQYLTGCTMGKGNLIHRDFGKMAFSFFHRPSGRGIRLLLNPELRRNRDTEMAELMGKKFSGEATPADEERIAALRSEVQEFYMGAELNNMFRCEASDRPLPRPPRILQSLACEACGENAMESRTRRFGGRTLCLPCFEKVEQKI